MLNFISEIHDRVSMARNKRGREKRGIICRSVLYLDEIVELYFFDIDFLTSPDVMLNLPLWFKETYNPEAFALSQGMLPHPEELALKVDTMKNPRYYKVTPQVFWPRSKLYPDWAFI